MRAVHEVDGALNKKTPRKKKKEKGGVTHSGSNPRDFQAGLRLFQHTGRGKETEKNPYRQGGIKGV